MRYLKKYEPFLENRKYNFSNEDELLSEEISLKNIITTGAFILAGLFSGNKLDAQRIQNLKPKEREAAIQALQKAQGEDNQKTLRMELAEAGLRETQIDSLMANQEENIEELEKDLEAAGSRIKKGQKGYQKGVKKKFFEVRTLKVNNLEEYTRRIKEGWVALSLEVETDTIEVPEITYITPVTIEEGSTTADTVKMGIIVGGEEGNVEFFKSGEWDLSEDAKNQIDELVKNIKEGDWSVDKVVFESSTDKQRMAWEKNKERKELALKNGFKQKGDEFVNPEDATGNKLLTKLRIEAMQEYFKTKAKEAGIDLTGTEFEESALFDKGEITKKQFHDEAIKEKDGKPNELDKLQKEMQKHRYSLVGVELSKTEIEETPTPVETPPTEDVDKRKTRDVVVVEDIEGTLIKTTNWVKKKKKKGTGIRIDWNGPTKAPCAGGGM